MNSFKACTLLTHQVNKGKGAALKTAISYVINERSEKKNIITTDSDGQHKVEDIIKISEYISSKEEVVLGVRDFSGSDIPFRSKIGNRITSFVFGVFLGMKIQDTQTGLRAFPNSLLKWLLSIEGERYEYEMNVLINIRKNKIPYHQIGINTVYIEENRSSHFKVVRDSIRIYGIILKYLVSSLSSSVIDELLFYLFKSFFLVADSALPITLIAAIFARIFSSAFNYWVNAKTVFKGKIMAKTIVKYYLLAAAQILLSGSLVLFLETMFHITSTELLTLVKTIIDCILFFGSFQIQHRWVFTEEKGANTE